MNRKKRNGALRMITFILLILEFCMHIAVAQQTKPEVWQPVRFLIGEWTGKAEGQAGSGTVQRTYSFVLNERYIHERNISSYPATENKKEEVHEHWSFISYDRRRKTFVLRQFHQEGFVNQYILNAAAGSPTKLVFESESFENLDNRWRARETYEIVSENEFIETFELAEPEKDFQIYSKNHFKREP